MNKKKEKNDQFNNKRRNKKWIKQHNKLDKIRNKLIPYFKRRRKCLKNYAE